MHFASPIRRVRTLAGAAAIGCLTACGAAPGPAAPVPPPAVRAEPAPGAVTLRQLGFANGPDFALPGGVRISQRVDQSNVVTVVMTEPTGVELTDWVRVRGQAAGWRVVATGPGAVVLDGTADGVVWDGSLAAGDPSALTFRRRA